MHVCVGGVLEVLWGEEKGMKGPGCDGAYLQGESPAGMQRQIHKQKVPRRQENQVIGECERDGIYWVIEE